MHTTKKANLRAKKFTDILLTLALFFTSCCFVDMANHGVFFIDFDYRVLKLLLAIVIPAVAVTVHYLCNRSLLDIADRTAVVMVIYGVLLLLDSATLRLMWDIEKGTTIYHIVYGLETFFTVLLMITLIANINQRRHIMNNHYGESLKAFFTGFCFLFAVDFFYIYIFLRKYDVSWCKPLNLVPFEGELKAYLTTHDASLLLRDAGNVFFFTAMSWMIMELCKKRRYLLGVVIPILTSVLMEVYQYLFHCGDADIDDVLLNTFGVVLGVLIYRLIIEKIKENELCWESLEQWMWK
ncbi:VanZ family protein [uncultured Eubacterium sp.]|uniref:VanZ family protein n=1 Tax=uncultured Eubacterium sp. TaxID=165185 RepID=UPI0015BB5FAC|nr:VanZ family protein [uncultured Eubacterium sp.]